jgi:hypothetical protein
MKLKQVKSDQVKTELPSGWAYAVLTSPQVKKEVQWGQRNCSSKTRKMFESTEQLMKRLGIEL